jgi:hypothetical protein
LHGRASDDPLGFFAGWKSYFLATYLLVGVVALHSGGYWFYWFAPAIVPLFLFTGVFYLGMSLKLVLYWFAMVATLVYAVHGVGGILEHWRTPRRSLRYVLILLVVIGSEVWILRTL